MWISLLFFAVFILSQEQVVSEQLEHCEKVFKQVEKWINEFDAVETATRNQLGSIQGKELELITRFLDGAKDYVHSSAQDVYDEFDSNLEENCENSYARLESVNRKMKNIYSKLSLISAREKNAGDQTEEMVKNIGHIIQDFDSLYAKLQENLENNDIQLKGEDISSIRERLKQLHSRANENIKKSYRIYTGNPMEYRNNFTSIKRLLDEVTEVYDSLVEIDIKIEKSNPNRLKRTLISSYASNHSTPELLQQLVDETQKASKAWSELFQLVNSTGGRNYKKEKRRKMFQVLRNAESVVNQYKGQDTYSTEDRQFIIDNLEEVIVLNGKLNSFIEEYRSRVQHGDVDQQEQQSIDKYVYFNDNNQPTKTPPEKKKKLSAWKVAVIVISLLLVCILAVAVPLTLLLRETKLVKEQEDEEDCIVSVGSSRSSGSKGGSSVRYHRSKQGSHASSSDRHLSSQRLLDSESDDNDN